jgi:hypothetical protein
MQHCVGSVEHEVHLTLTIEQFRDDVIRLILAPLEILYLLGKLLASFGKNSFGL